MEEKIFKVQFKKIVYMVTVSDDCITIANSYRITSKTDMKLFVEHLRVRFSESKVFSKRTTKSLINEWRVHNLLYSLGISKERTQSVDLNQSQSTMCKILYTILSPFYFHFK